VLPAPIEVAAGEARRDRVVGAEVAIGGAVEEVGIELEDVLHDRVDAILVGEHDGDVLGVAPLAEVGRVPVEEADAGLVDQRRGVLEIDAGREALLDRRVARLEAALGVLEALLVGLEEQLLLVGLLEEQPAVGEEVVGAGQLLVGLVVVVLVARSPPRTWRSRPRAGRGRRAARTRRRRR
jgi:hypothetical protein